MKSGKKIVVLVLASALCLGLSIPAFADNDMMLTFMMRHGTSCSYDVAEEGKNDAVITAPNKIFDNMLIPETKPDFISASAPATVDVTVNGKAVRWMDATPYIDANNRTLVPLRAVGDALDLTVSWDGQKHEAVFSDGKRSICFPIDSAVAHTSEGETKQMDTAAVIVNDRTYAPVRYLAEFFGHAVNWDKNTSTVVIESRSVYQDQAVEWKTAYALLLDKEQANNTGNPENDAVRYYLYDIDKDDVPELFIEYGNYEAACLRHIYTCDASGCVSLGELPGGHEYLSSYPGKNGFVSEWVHMGADSARRIYLEDGSLLSEEIFGWSMFFSEDPKPVLTDYVPGSQPLERYPIADRTPLSLEALL